MLHRGHINIMKLEVISAGVTQYMKQLEKLRYYTRLWIFYKMNYNISNHFRVSWKLIKVAFEYRFARFSAFIHTHTSL